MGHDLSTIVCNNLRNPIEKMLLNSNKARLNNLPPNS